VKKENPMSKKMKKRLIGMAAMVAVTAGGLFYWHESARAKTDAPLPTATARKGDLTLKVSATGTVEPEYTVEIKSKASGVVDKVTVQEGDQVSRGQLLIRIDPIVERRHVMQALADVQMAQAQVQSAGRKRDYAQSEMQREDTLLQKGLVSAAEADTQRKEAAVSRSDAQNSAAMLLRAREAYQEAKDRLDETEIKSPISGIVLERDVQPGMIVASGTTAVNGGTTLLKIADLGQLYVRVKVDEADVAKLAIGQPVQITADALPGKTFGGKVLRIAPQGKVDSNVTVFEVIVAADAEGSKALRPMMTANVDVLVAEHKDATLVPMRAVRAGEQKGGKLVTVDGAARPVQVGLSDGKDVEILSGVTVGEQVALQPPRSQAKPQDNQGGQNVMRMRGALGGGK
jgi:HlyD family secretion protein